MNIGATLANTAWLLSSRAATTDFHRGLRDPALAQQAWLTRQLTRDADSEFGQTHDFATLRGYDDFARRVPLSDYADVESAVTRIRRGAPAVLGSSPVTHLVPTSGSSGARKLIPFTADLARAFDAAIAPWMADLVRQRPGVRGGPAYWSISPLTDSTGDETAEWASASGAATTGDETAERALTSAAATTDDDTDERASASGAATISPPGSIPVGFADDTEYLGGSKAWLLRRVLAVPSSVRHVRSDSEFWALTLLALLRRGDLRLVSVWHPSFLELLVGRAQRFWSELTGAIASGANPWLAALPADVRREWQAKPSPLRARTLERLGPDAWERWWPQLEVVSCWGEQAAAPGWRRLKERLPQVLVQPKGLLATEAVVTVPVGAALPLAITSHFFEFESLADGTIRRAHELERGAQYAVIVSNGAGLWRYRLGDVVECSGLLAATPSLRFLGRRDAVSDLRGEKLSEPFVAECLRVLWEDGAVPDPSGMRTAVLRAVDDGSAGGYELLLADEIPANVRDALAQRMDNLLHANPHYTVARRLGQLSPVRAVPVDAAFAMNDVHHQADARAVRLGDIKPRVLIRAGS